MPNSGSSVSPACRAAIAGLLLVSGAHAVAAAPRPGQPAPRGVLELRGGGFVAGELVPSAAGGVRDAVAWQAPAFAAPFAFQLADVSGIRFGQPLDPGKESTDSVRIYFRGGDAITGTIRAIDADTITIDAPVGDDRQTLRIDRTEVESIARPGAGGGSYDGPAGLAGWEQKPADAWREEAGRLLTSRRGASVSRDVAAPPRARYDITVSWTTAAEFRFSLVSAGMAEGDQFALEVLRPGGGPPTLAVVRRQAGKAALEPVPLDPGAESLRMVLFVDQLRGRMTVVLPDAGDEPAADVVLERGAEAEPLPGVRLLVTSGDVCLESLRVTPWTTAQPTLDDIGGTTIALRAADKRTGEVEGFDPAAAAFVVKQAGRITRIPVADVDQIAFPWSATRPPRQPAEVRMIGVAGDVVSGGLVNVDRRGTWIRRPGVAEPIGMSFTHLVALQSLVPAAQSGELPGREGWLEGEGFAMRGALAAVAGRVGWQPVGSVVASPFATTAVPFSGRLDYVPRSTAADESAGVGGIGGMVGRSDDGSFVITMLAEDGAAAQDGRLQPGDRLVAIAPAEKARFVPITGLDTEEVTDLLRGRIGTPVRIKVTDAAGENPRTIELVRGRLAIAASHLLGQALQTHAALAAPQPSGDSIAYPSIVVLTTGESAACRIMAIDAERLRLVTPLGGTPLQPIEVPAAVVKAVEFDPSVPGRALDKVRFERLLTIPRMQRSRPPTHVLRMKNGDYVRGRLVEADDERVRFELPGKEQVFPLAAVARAIWLHPEEPDAQAGGPAARPAGPQGLAVTGIWPGGRRMGLAAATAVEERSLVGSHVAFGQARIDTDNVERLLFGAEADKEAGQRPYAQWKVRPALEPRALREKEPARESVGG